MTLIASEEGPVDAESGVPEYTLEEFRESTHRFGENPTFLRRIVETKSSIVLATTDTRSFAEKRGIYHGSAHPDIPGLYCTELVESQQVTTGNQGLQTVTELIATYTLPFIEGRPIETGQAVTFEESPLARPDTWSFQTQGAAVPALFYYDGSTQKPLTNSAFDYLSGLEVDEAQTKVIIRGNRSTFPSGTATAITNCVNSDSFLGAGENKWKCQGIQGELKYELVNGSNVRYWEVTVELMFRQTGWNLLIPDVGFNYLDGGEKKRALVKSKDPDTGSDIEVASADVVGLDGSGGLSLTGAPAILDRRIYKQVAFGSYFGTPPQ